MHPPAPDPEDTAYPDWLRDALETGRAEPADPDEPMRPEEPAGPIDAAGPDEADRREEANAGPGRRAEPARGDRRFAEPRGADADDAARRGAEPFAPPGVDAARNGRLLYRGLQISLSDSQQLKCRVALRGPDGDVFGTAEGRNVPTLRARIAATATLDALARASGRADQLALGDADVVTAIGAEVVVVGIYASGGRQVVPLVGVSPVHDSVEHAAVLATLQATNRWLGRDAREDGNRGGFSRPAGPWWP